MAANNSSSVLIETRCGKVRLRKRGNLWYARKQNGKQRIELALRTGDLVLAIDRAQLLIPERIIGANGFADDGRSIAIESDYKRIFKTASRRAKDNGIEFTLSESDIADLIQTSNGFCSLTHIPFSTARIDGAYRAPYAPSLDRIDSARGYHKDNVRLVCVAVNWALSDWGQGVFEAIATGYVSSKLREFCLIGNGAKNQTAK